MQRSPLVFILLPFALGIFLGLQFEQVAHLASFSCAVAPFLILAFVVMQEKAGLLHRLAMPFLALFILDIGFLLCSVTLEWQRVAWQQGRQTYAVTVDRVVKKGERTTTVDAQVERGAAAGRRVRLFFPDSVRVATNQALWVRAEMESPRNAGNPSEFDYAAYLKTQGISGTAYVAACAQASVPFDAAFSLKRPALALRDRLRGRYERFFAGDELAVLSAMTLGDRTAMTAAAREAFAETGTSHVLALSGLHLGILFFFFELFVIRPLRHSRLRPLAVIVSVGLVWCYALMAGLPHSLVRAALMLSVAQLLSLVRHRTLGLNSLLLAALIMLLANPLTLFDVGFQLSFLSVCSIVVLMPPCGKFLKRIRLRPLRALVKAFLVSLCALAGTWPLVAFKFHLFTPYAPLVNLPVVPLVGALLLVALLFLLLPFASALLAPCLSWLLSLLEQTLSAVRSLPGSSLELYPSVATILLAYVAMGFCLWAFAARKWWRWACSMLAASCACAYYIGVDCSQDVSPGIVFYNLRRGSAAEFIASRSESYVYATSAEARERFLSISHDFHARKGLAPACPIDTSGFRLRTLFYQGGVVQFAGRRTAILDRKIGRAVADAPLAVDYLLVCRGFSGEPARAFGLWKPKLVVIDSSLGPVYTRMWREEARLREVPVHDMHEQGALVQPVSGAP